MTLILSGTDGLSDIDGSASTPAIRGTDANTGIFFPAADTIAFAEGGAEVARFDSAGNFGINTSSPTSKLQVEGSVLATGASSALRVNEDGAGTKIISIRSDFAGVGPTINVQTNHPLIFNTNNTEQARITTAGLFQFNSGYGSVATAYGCRAWVNFNGTGTVAIRASGNVTSITDNGTGIYTVNFTNAFPDTNFTMIATSGALSPSSGFSIAMGNNTYTTSSAQIYTTNNVSAVADQAVVGVAFFR
jgi:hypothetical protein